MIINNYKWENKYISLEAHKIEIPDAGITIIRGENGIGKTTFLNSLMFDFHDITFSNSAYGELYEKNRGYLFCYIPQAIPNPEMKVKDYMELSKKTEKEEILELLQEFHLSQDILNKNVKQLSGGERTKICLITAMKKGCPYIILDEPTNNLDNQSSAALMDCLKRLGKKRSIIISTHDERVFELADTKLYFEGGYIRTETVVPMSSVDFLGPEAYETFRENVVKSTIGKYLRRNTGHLMLHSVLLCFIVMLTVFTHNYFDIKYSVQENELVAGSILAYSVDNVYADLNDNYAKAENLKIAKEDYKKMVQYQDIPKIAQQDDVEGILIWDELAYDKLRTQYDLDFNPNGNEKHTIMTLPEVVTTNYMETVGLLYYFALKEGRYPKDGVQEIVIPPQQIKEVCGTEDAQQCIGRKIPLEGKEYTIVGVGSSNISLVSYGEPYESVFYQYDPADYKEFVKKNIDYKIRGEYFQVYETDKTIYLTKKGQERKVLNRLMETFPANNYYSYEYANIWKHRYNTIALWKFFFGNIIVLSVVFFLLHIIIKHVLKNDSEFIRYCACSCLDSKMVQKKYVAATTVYSAITVGVTLLLVITLLKISLRIEVEILAVNTMLIVAFLFLKCKKGMKGIIIC